MGFLAYRFSKFVEQACFVLFLHYTTFMLFISVPAFCHLKAASCFFFIQDFCRQKTLDRFYVLFKTKQTKTFKLFEVALECDIFKCQKSSVPVSNFIEELVKLFFIFKEIILNSHTSGFLNKKKALLLVLLYMQK